MGGYFHQDWRVESTSAAGVVSHFVHNEPTNVLRALVAELDALLGAGLNERELSAVLESAGAALDPSAEGMSTAHWLAWVREQLRSAIS